jgi:hypothetical protein
MTESFQSRVFRDFDDDGARQTFGRSAVHCTENVVQCGAIKSLPSDKGAEGACYDPALLEAGQRLEDGIGDLQDPVADSGH